MNIQAIDHRLIRRIQRLDVIFGNVGIESDLVTLVAGAVLDFKDAAGAYDVMDRFSDGAAVGRNTLEHYGSVADGHEPRALEHMHQGQ